MNEIEIELDHEARILSIRIVGDVTDERALQKIPQTWRDHPEVREYDSIIDLTRDHGAISWGAVAAIADKWHAFVGPADSGRQTALVVRDALWETIVTVIATRFPHRRFEAFRTTEDARRWLEAKNRATLDDERPQPPDCDLDNI